ncbi:MAG TPA: Stk1 family PASTA domain-containing Ser/Thr kinase, partial [Candidatus Acutalibacter ornithocaccae]|nr:Stk1 family PASTA domain-containing Ser/Thr kinase [Candidatus Acutalibacter ornithocaccae]
MDRFIGKRLDGRYEIHELIGVGGMAYVYKAYDRVEGRWVAIKILKEEFSNNSDFLRRFRNESKAIAVLNHPNIVKVYDVSFGDQIQYIVMEFIDGITLKEYIEQEGTIRWQEAVHFTTQILMALECAHEKGIIHRDIKPQNIMLLQDGSIKVADFGIARFLQSETQTMTDKAIGSVHYIAPEQASGDYITDKADIYSVGVMLYEMLTGKLPFVADNAVSVALMQLQAKPVMPRELNPSIPRGLEQITMRAMEKNPVDRFQSAGEMLDDLDEFRRNPNIVFHYDLQTANARYDASRSMEAYDASRQAPAYNDDYEYEEELVRSRRSAKGAMVVKGVLAAAIIVGLAVAVIYFLNYWNNRPEAGDDLLEMPNLVGQLYEDVIANEEYADFNIQVREGNDPDLQPGEIMNQDPAAGIMVKKDADVELLVNGGVGQVEVPDVVTDHMTLEEAQQAIEDAGLHSQVENVADDEVEEGRVISTNPEPGTMVDSGSTVTLRVSTGPAEEMVAVPDGLVGDTLANVSAKLEEAGLVVGNVNRDDTSTLTVDTVISLSPNEGSEISKGSTVDITVSSGKGATKTLSTSIPLPSSVSEDITLEVYRNGTKVTTDTVNPAYGSSYSLSFTGTSGSETVVVT